MSTNKNLDLQSIVSRVLSEMKEECQKEGTEFSLERINLAEFQRRSGLSRERSRTLQRHKFEVRPHGNTGKKRELTVLSGFDECLSDELRTGLTNSDVLLRMLRERGYKGSLTTVKTFILDHKSLVPAPRQAVEPQGNRGRRYSSGPGESYQMDWGFIKVIDDLGNEWNTACFVMVCHHCGFRYIEFFPNAKQENLFIGMIHAFMVMGIPKEVLTDNMKSVVDHRDETGAPVWNLSYEVFMKTVGFGTKLCKPRHPFTKGAAERLVAFVKGNFTAGRTFTNVTDLNAQAFEWCMEKNSKEHPEHACIPSIEHKLESVTLIGDSTPLIEFLAPMRRISFDGFVNYEGRRYGVPYRFIGKQARVMRDNKKLLIIDPETLKPIQEYQVTWGKLPQTCPDQWYVQQPEELPTMPVSVSIRRIEPQEQQSLFSRYDFSDGGGKNVH